ncbi:MAG: MAC/perforin domain-containing protein [Methylococcaceae bacterium]
MSLKMRVMWASLSLWAVSFATGVGHADPYKDGCPSGLCSGLGQGFYLSKINVLDPKRQTSGSVILKDTAIGTCAKKSDTKSIDQVWQTSEDSQTAIRNFSNSFSTPGAISIPVGQLTLGATIDAGYESSSSFTADANYSSLEIYQYTGIVDIVQNEACYSESNFTQRFKDAFESLALKDANSADELGYWGDYTQFLNTWGTHIQTKQILGSSLIIAESEKSSTKVTAQQLNAKVCAKLAGFFEACNTTSKTDQETASKLETKESIYMAGGSRQAQQDLRADAAGGYDQKLIDAFIASASDSIEPVSFHYIPIWDMLNDVYRIPCGKSANKETEPACKNLQRVINLQAAYEGFLANQCETKNTPPAKAGDAPYFVQGMVAFPANGNGISYYGCKMAKTGCMTDNDCAIGDDGLFETHSCFCAGPSCIDAVLISGYKNQYRNVIKNTENNMNDSVSETGVNASCPDNKGCGCNTAWGAKNQGERYVWDQTTGGLGAGTTDYGASPKALKANASTPPTSNDPETYTVSVIIKEKDKERGKSGNNPVVIRSAGGSGKPIECPGICEKEFNKGALVTLIAEPKKGNLRFSHWSKDTCKTIRGRQCVLPAVIGNISIEAHYH